MRILLLALLCASGLCAQTFAYDEEGLLLAPTIAHVEALPDYGAGANARDWTDDHLRALAKRVRRLTSLDLRGNQNITFEALLDAAYQLPGCRVWLDGCRQFWPRQMNELLAAGANPSWNLAWLPDAKIVSVEDGECSLQSLGASLPGAVGFAICAPHAHSSGAMKAFGYVYTFEGRSTLTIRYTLDNAKVEPGDVVVHPFWHQNRFLEWHCAGDLSHALGHYPPEEGAEPEEPSPDEPRRPLNPNLEARKPFYEDETFESRGHEKWSPEVEIVVFGKNLLGDEDYREARNRYALCLVPASEVLAFLYGGAQRYDGEGWVHVDSDAELEAVWPETTRLRARNVTPGALAKALPQMLSLNALDLQGCTLDETCAKLIWNCYYLNELNLRGAVVPEAATAALLGREYDTLDLSHVNGRGPEIPEEGLSEGTVILRSINLSGNASLVDEQVSRLANWGSGAGWDEAFPMALDVSHCTSLTGSFLDGFDGNVANLNFTGCSKLQGRWIVPLAGRFTAWVTRPVGLADLAFKPADWITALPLTDGEGDIYYPHLDLRGAKLDAAALAHLAKLRADSIDLRRCAAATPETVKGFRSPVLIDGEQPPRPAPALRFWPKPAEPYVISGVKDVYPGLEDAQWVKLVGRPPEADWPRLPYPLPRLELERCDLFFVQSEMRNERPFLEARDAEFRRDGDRWAWLQLFERMSPRAGLTLNTGVFLPTFHGVPEEYRERLKVFSESQDSLVEARAKYDAARVAFEALKEPEWREDFTDEERDAYERAMDEYDVARTDCRTLEARWELSFVVLESVTHDLSDWTQTHSERSELRSYLCARVDVLGEAFDKAFRAWAAKPDDALLKAAALSARDQVLSCLALAPHTEMGDAWLWAPNREADIGHLRELSKRMAGLDAEHEKQIKAGKMDESEGRLADDLTERVDSLLYDWLNAPKRVLEVTSWPVEDLHPVHLHNTSTFTLRISPDVPREHFDRLGNLAPFPTGLDASGNAGFDDAALANFQSFTRLRRLNLAGTGVTLKSVRPLILKGKVRELDLTGCKGLSEKEKEALRIVFPDIEIKG